MIRTAVIALFLATPAAAQDWSAVEQAAGDLNSEDPELAYRGAVAACMAGMGDVEKTAAFLTSGGWTRKDQAEMGTIDYLDPRGALYVLQADDGSFCAAYSETLGTNDAIRSVQYLGGVAKSSFRLSLGESGCVTIDIAPGAQAEITSSGNDPVCQDDTTSSVRFTFGPVQ